MTRPDIRVQLRAILDAHDAALTSIRRAHQAIEDAPAAPPTRAAGLALQDALTLLTAARPWLLRLVDAA